MLILDIITGKIEHRLTARQQIDLIHDARINGSMVRLSVDTDTLILDFTDSVQVVKFVHNGVVYTLTDNTLIQQFFDMLEDTLYTHQTIVTIYQ